MRKFANLRHGGEESDEVGDGEADKVAVGGGVEGLGAAHGDHDHGVAEHAGQQDGGLEHGAHQPVHPPEVLGVVALLRRLGAAVESRF